ncbi:MAG: restriction endonuclease subunit S [Myroides sp.]
MKINIGNDLYLKGRIGWKGLSKDEYLEKSNYRIINGYSLKDGYVDWDIAGYISRDRYEESPEIKLEIDDILISKDGTIGKVGIVRELELPSTVASGIFVLRNIIKDRLDTEYLFQYLKSSNFKNFINRVKASGSTIIHLYQRDLVKLEIDLPSLKEQKLISSLLKNLDDKIELNNKINAELEAMAKTLYDYWFVQFDFPDEEGKPFKSSGGKMVWNGELKREIPEGWEVKSLSYICEIINGYAFKSEWYTDSGIKIIRTKNFENGYVDLNDLVFLDNEFAKQFDKYQLKTYDFLMVMVGASTGKHCTVNSNILPALQNQNMWRFISKIENQQLFLNLKLQRIVLELENTTNGSARGFFQKDSFLSKIVEVPNRDLIEDFCNKINSVFKRIDNNLKENQELASLRDWLLPMLMNGQVRIE